MSASGDPGADAAKSKQSADDDWPFIDVAMMKKRYSLYDSDDESDAEYPPWTPLQQQHAADDAQDDERARRRAERLAAIERRQGSSVSSSATGSSQQQAGGDAYLAEQLAQQVALNNDLRRQLLNAEISNAGLMRDRSAKETQLRQTFAAACRISDLQEELRLEREQRERSSRRISDLQEKLRDERGALQLLAAPLICTSE